MKGDRLRRFAVAALVLAGLAVTVPAGAQQDETETEPRGSGLVERTGITLMFLDVEVTDDEGRPVPGLTRDDFEIQLSGRFHPIYSVDDLCSCTNDASRAGAIPGQAETPFRARAEPPPTDAADPLLPPGTHGAAASETRQYVIYFDFSQLQLDGRERAIGEAERWVRESLQPGSLARVDAYSSRAGLRELCPLTADKQQLLDAIDAARDDPELIDVFPSRFSARVMACWDCCRAHKADASCTECGDTCCRAICLGNAWDEFQHGRRAMKALRALLRSLEHSPGPKTLVMFHQNGIIYPARFYPVDIADHVALLDDVGAEATLSRTTVYPVYSGSLSRMESSLADQAVNLGANLAEYTGGKYNRSNTDFSALVDSAFRPCTCTYRIGLRPPDGARGRVFRAKVWAAGRPVAYRYRTQFLDELDRWWRRAQSLIAHPESARDLPVSVALIPRLRDGTGWVLGVQVAVDAAALMLLPTAGEQIGQMEIGGLLTRNDGSRNWEMIGRSTVVPASEIRPGTFVVHEREMSGLNRGSYRLGAFVRDRTANVFGAAEASLILPRVKQDGVVGPVLLLADRTRVSSWLPLFEERAAPERSTKAMESGPVPAPDGPVPAGGPLEIVTWICPGADAAPPEQVLRSLSRGDRPVLRFEDRGSMEPAGSCVRITDRVETAAVSPGDYNYHAQWSGSGGEHRFTELSFAIAAPPGEPDRSPPDEPTPTMASEPDRPTPDEPTPTMASEPDRPTPDQAPPPDDPETLARAELLARIMPRMSRVAALYRDEALRFTCDETILYTGLGESTLHRFGYVYRRSDDGRLLDYRVPQGRAADPDLPAPRKIRLDNYGLPVYMLRPYSWVFIFEQRNQSLYAFELQGDDEVFDRPAWRVRFEPVPPIQRERNDWFGTAWIDRETYQILRVVALRPEDAEKKRMMETRHEQTGDSHPWTGTLSTFDTDFDVLKNGQRFPGIVRIRHNFYEAWKRGKPRERNIFTITQTYKRYRFFGVKTREEIEAIVLAPN